MDAADGTTTAVLTHDAVPDDPLRKVDGTPPEPGVTVWPRTRTVPEGGTAKLPGGAGFATKGFRDHLGDCGRGQRPGPRRDAGPAHLHDVELEYRAERCGVGGRRPGRYGRQLRPSGTPPRARTRITAASRSPDVAAAENDDEYAHFIPFFPSASTGSSRDSPASSTGPNEAGDVYIFGIDDDGVNGMDQPGSPCRSWLLRTSTPTDLEDGNPDKGLTHGLGDGAGMLAPGTRQRSFESCLSATSALTDGFVTAMQDCRGNRAPARPAPRTTCRSSIPAATTSR